MFDRKSNPNPEIAGLHRLAHRMDNALRIPVVGVRVGWDSILGLIPGIGDALALAPAAYIVQQSHRLGAPRSVLARQAANIGIDLAIGTIPLIGDLFDIGWKANTRNVNLLDDHLQIATRNKKGPPVGDPLVTSRNVST